MEEKVKAEKGDDGKAVALSKRSHQRGFNRPSWLLFAIADLDEKMKMLTLNIPEEDTAATFSKRAEAYYQQRPQLLALLQDLYNGYLTLSDRYCQTLAKNHRRRHSYSSDVPTHQFEESNRFGDEENVCDIDSDAESSLSYQTTFQPPPQAKLDTDTIVAELVIKTVDYEIFMHELSVVERRSNESSKKIELQKSLLDVLESERMILLNENARLVYKVNVLMEENKGLASESLFMKRKAGELARCVLKMREDHRVCILSRKIEDLQGQIYGLEKRNKEYHEQLVKQDEEKKSDYKKKIKSKNGGRKVVLEDCFQEDEEASVSTSRVGNMLKGYRSSSVGGGGRKGFGLWDRVKNFDLLLCGPHFNST